MAVLANIAPNISTTQTGNFQFTIVFDDVRPEQTITGFDLSDNLAGTQSSDVSKSDMTLLSLVGNVAVIAVILPDEVNGRIRLRVRRKIEIDGEEEDLTGTDRRINYDTRGSIEATLGNPTYNSDRSISVPVNFDEDVTSLSYTDFNLIKESGNDIYGFETWLTGTGSNYELHLLPEIDTVGVVKIIMLGDSIPVSSSVTKEEVADPITIGYDARVPFVEDFYFPASLPTDITENEEWIVYLEFNVRIRDLNTDSFIYQGVNLSNPSIQRLNSVGVINVVSSNDFTDNTDLVYTATTGEDPDLVDNGDLGVNTADLTLYKRTGDMNAQITDLSDFFSVSNSVWLGGGTYAESGTENINSDTAAETWIRANRMRGRTYFWYDSTSESINKYHLNIQNSDFEDNTPFVYAAGVPTLSADDNLGINTVDKTLYIRIDSLTTRQINSLSEFFSDRDARWLGGESDYAELHSQDVNSFESARIWMQNYGETGKTYFWYDGISITKLEFITNNIIEPDIDNEESPWETPNGNSDWVDINPNGNTVRSKFFRLVFNITPEIDTNGIFSLILKDDVVINAEYITGETAPQPVRSPEEPAQDEEVIRPTGEFVRVGTSTNFGVNEIYPTGIAYNRNDDILYMVGNTNDALFSVNFTTGVATRIGSSTQFGVSERSPGGLTYNPNTDTLYMVGRHNDALYSINTQNGNGTHVTNIIGLDGNPSDPNGIAYDPTNDILYVIDNISNSLTTLDITTGNLTRIGSATNFGVNEGTPTGLAYDSNNGILYMVGRDNDALYEIDVETGIASRVNNINQFGLSEGNVGGLTYDPINSLLYMLGQNPSALLKGLTTTN